MQTSALPIARVPATALAAYPAVALLASGPSLHPRDVWAAAQAGWGLVGCNNQCLYALDILWAPDHRWLEEVAPRRTAHIPWRFTTQTPGQRRRREPPPIQPGWHYIDTDPMQAFSTDPTVLARGQHAGYQLINLAALAGARRMALLGYDGHKPPGQPRHWFGSHPGALDVASRYPEFNANYPLMRPGLRAIGAEVVNATAGSAIDAFPRASLEDLIACWQ